MAGATLLFVYGTLRSGAANHRKLAGAISRGPARTVPRYDLLDLGPYPALVTPGSVAVVGELYLVDTPLLAELDRFEGRAYARMPVALEDAGVRGVRAEAYFLRSRARSYPRIDSGDWLSHR